MLFTEPDIKSLFSVLFHKEFLALIFGAYGIYLNKKLFKYEKNKISYKKIIFYNYCFFYLPAEFEIVYNLAGENIIIHFDRSIKKKKVFDFEKIKAILVIFNLEFEKKIVIENINFQYYNDKLIFKKTELSDFLKKSLEGLNNLHFFNPQSQKININEEKCDSCKIKPVCKHQVLKNAEIASQ